MPNSDAEQPESVSLERATSESAMDEGAGAEGTGFVPSPLADFPAIDQATWRQRVTEELGGRPFSSLQSTTADGLTLEPLYGAESTPVAAMPGLAPFRRGTRPVGGATPWQITLEVDDPRPDAAAAEIAEGVDRGVSLLWLRSSRAFRLGSPGSSDDADRSRGLRLSSATELGAQVAGVDLGRVAVRLDVGAMAPTAAALWLAVAEDRGVERAGLRGSWGGDPLGALASDGMLPWDLETCGRDLADLAAWSARETPQMRTVLISTEPYHDAGSSPADEVAFALASGARALRWLTDHGMDLESAAQQLGFAFSIGRELFVEIAKLRAFRQLWAGIVRHAGGSATLAAVPIHARTSAATWSRREPWLNLLRASAEGFSAVLAGVDSLTLAPYDTALGGSTAATRRHALQAHHLLAEEAHLGRVADPAGGSWAVESITDSVGRAAWRRFQEIEELGGMAIALLDGEVAHWIEESLHQRRERLARRADKVVGVSSFPNLAEEPVEREAPVAPPPPEESFPPARAAARLEELVSVLERTEHDPGERFSALLAAVTAGATTADVAPLLRTAKGGSTTPEAPRLALRRWPAPFEDLRDASDAWLARHERRPRVAVAPLGPLSEHGPRVDFARNFFAAGGIETPSSESLVPTESATAERLVEVFRQSEADGVVLCGPDALYAEQVPEVASQLKAAGARWIFLAGRPGEAETSYRDAGVDTFIFLGCDVLAVLEAFLGDLEVI